MHGVRRQASVTQFEEYAGASMDHRMAFMQWETEFTIQTIQQQFFNLVTNTH